MMEKKYGIWLFYLICDIMDMDVLKGLLDVVVVVYGLIMVLVNNVVNDKCYKIEDVDEDFWEWLIVINLKVYFFVC